MFDYQMLHNVIIFVGIYTKIGAVLLAIANHMGKHSFYFSVSSYTVNCSVGFITVPATLNVAISGIYTGDERKATTNPIILLYHIEVTI